MIKREGKRTRERDGEYPRRKSGRRLSNKKYSNDDGIDSEDGFLSTTTRHSIHL